MSKPPVTERFSRADVEAWLGKHTLKKAEPYVDDVQELDVKTHRIVGQVQGTAAHPYLVLVHFLGDKPADGIMSGCTCPVRHQCKHAAAVLLRALKERLDPDRVSPGVLSWISDLRQLTQAVEKKSQSKRNAPSKPRLFYLLDWQSGEVRIRLCKGSRPDTARPWSLTERTLVQPPQFIEDDDLPILRLLWAGRAASFPQEGFGLGAQKGSELLQKLLGCGRLIAGQPPITLAEGPARPGQIVWKTTRNGLQQPRLLAQPEATLVIPTAPPWYLDMEEGWAGPLLLEQSPDLAQKLLTLPPLSPREAALVADALAEVAPGIPAPAADLEARCRVVDTPPRGELRLDTLDVHGIRAWRGYATNFNAHAFDYAEASLCYGEVRLAFDDPREYVTLPDGELVRLKRQPEAEARLLKQLAAQGLEPVPTHALYCFGKRPAKLYGLASEADWPDFMAEGLPRLQAAGWRVDFPPAFRHHYWEVEAWDAQVQEGSGDWLDLDMGVVVEGQRLPLAPLLADLFHRDPRWLDAISLAEIAPDEGVELVTEDERRLRVPAERLKPLARLLIDLFDGYKEGPLRLSRLDAPRLEELQDRSRWQFRGPDSVFALAERLKASQGVRAVDPPRGFKLELRDYQRTGLAWLQYLREQGLAGILADDMGLGKTAQALAHLLLEKEAGRLDKPALVVLPTSLIFNWKNEAARFAPDLKVLSLHGQERKQGFALIPEHDVVLTTYPLLWRDGELLQQHEYHLLVLDEAQTVKNSRSKSAGVVRQLKARHRLCLTGTPLENHLGELWAQFDFLLPGFLGDSKSFTRLWRNPIEKQGDTLRRDLLARRLRPFILRRRKDDVATELPPKTVIVRTVELQGGQRDLYETVRAAMDEKVRSEIASRGFRRSQIVILDALLKLRQVCCDPRLVKSSAARKVKERAKLDLLMDMLPELVDEGRRILVFSQFTSMLDLIQAELDGIGLSHVRLTGATQDRETPIRAFQAGQVPIFLISLKAGGVGLNLTAADTVIHYDPWWNPAVENQATDRAHRLGQDKPVFVYKLIAAGSIEEKILALQERKAELAASLLSEERQGEVKFGEADLAALFEPLPG
ncbi:DEAD/DEAH box helicase [Azovibrio restrictus]|uniref:DEAD/DEAH box helicase n=1 Tax=Azovibrio restrictus TaxID=146938 RepID=UPI0026EF4AB9|nr:DEAD/DEAH box helicase [Azovibrio restrictus]